VIIPRLDSDRKRTANGLQISSGAEGDRPPHRLVRRPLPEHDLIEELGNAARVQSAPRIIARVFCLDRSAPMIARGAVEEGISSLLGLDVPVDNLNGAQADGIPAKTTRYRLPR
jgi:hypothetical protein